MLLQGQVGMNQGLDGIIVLQEQEYISLLNSREDQQFLFQTYLCDQIEDFHPRDFSYWYDFEKDRWDYIARFLIMGCEGNPLSNREKYPSQLSFSMGGEK